mmetsp:Transcript_39893/g.29428  ORF Transcript_39893/g.29428 Transcript_39893/m.29428 type:complete len:93 (-) Transcript_39893:35-313(-)
MDVTTASEATAKNISKLQLLQGRHPQTIAGVAIFIISSLSTEKRSCAEIAKAVNMTEPTIRQAYKIVYEFRDKILPEWWKPAEDLSILSEPL